MVAAADLTGMRFSRLTVIERVGSRAGHGLWSCLCDCGKYSTVIATNLKKGNTKSCGCYSVESLHSRMMDLSGQKYGMLTVTGMRGRKNGRTYAECLCDCGTKTVIGAHELRGGSTRSCGCIFLYSVTDHGKHRSPEYNSWEAMIQRCLNPKCPSFGDYGGRGIGVFNEWTGRGGFKSFYAYIGDRPSKNHSLDRYPNNNGNYEPGNVRWATRNQQAENKRGIKLISHGGESMCRAAWARKLGCSPGAIVSHLKKGRSFDWIVEHFSTNAPLLVVVAGHSGPEHGPSGSQS